MLTKAAHCALTVKTCATAHAQLPLKWHHMPATLLLYDYNTLTRVHNSNKTGSLTTTERLCCSPSKTGKHTGYMQPLEKQACHIKQHNYETDSQAQGLDATSRTVRSKLMQASDNLQSTIHICTHRHHDNKSSGLM
jgi:hypothetical protein